MPRSLPFTPGYFHGTSVVEWGRRLRQGHVSAVGLAQAALDSIARLDPLLNAFVHVNAQGALAQAAAADAALASGHDAGPLLGIPIAIKDNIDTADMPTTYGSAHFAVHRPARDARCVQRLRDAGAVVLGKTLTHEFAYGPTGDRSLQGASRNPWDDARMSGGSSAGSAVAVAAGLVPLALGTDTGGSVRIPSGLCAAVGFKPGHGVVPMDGVFALSSTLDHVGVIAQDVSGTALVFAALDESGARCPSAVAAPRVGWIDPQLFGPHQAAVTAAVKCFAEQIFAQPMTPLDGFDAWVPALKTAVTAIQRAEAYAVHQQRVARAPQHFDPEVLERLRLSAEVRGWEYVSAMKTRQALIEATAGLFRQVDLLVLPTLPVTAPLLQQREVQVQGTRLAVRDALLSLTSAWNLTGLPAISVPAGQVDGLPVGLQVVAARGQEWALLGALQRSLVAA